MPPELLKPEAREKLEVYYQEVRKKIRVLLEKSVRTHESNLLMMERLGVKNEWRDKSKLAYAKIQQLLDPSFKAEFAPGGAAARHGQGGRSRLAGDSSAAHVARGSCPIQKRRPRIATRTAAPSRGPTRVRYARSCEPRLPETFHVVAAHHLY